MSSDTRAALRGLGILGATVAGLTTFLPWYVFEVVLPVGGVTHVFAVPITLWGLTTLAPILIVVGAAVALLCLSFVRARWASAVAAVIGLGISAYAVVRCFDVPSFGVDLLPASSGLPRAKTQLEGGPILAIGGGLMLLAGSLADLLAPRRREAATPATATPAATPAEGGVPFEPGAQPGARVR